MPRDVLLVLLALAALLNAVLLVWAAAAWRRGAFDEQPSIPPPDAVTAPEPLQARRAALPGPAIEASPWDRQRRSARSGSIETPWLSAPTRPADAASTPAADTDPTSAPQPPSPVRSESEPAETPDPKPAPSAAEPPVPIGARRPKTTRSNGRGRRFVMPQHEEDEHRSNRAIAAFFDSHIAPSAPPGRPGRRRHRARRPPGLPPPRTRLELALDRYSELERTVGRAAASRVLGALTDALRRGARGSDEIREIGQGRVTVSLECDEAGAAAYSVRAQSVVAPWLGALAVPLTMTVRTRGSGEESPADSA